MKIFSIIYNTMIYMFAFYGGTWFSFISIHDIELIGFSAFFKPKLIFVAIGFMIAMMHLFAVKIFIKIKKEYEEK